MPRFTTNIAVPLEVNFDPRERLALAAPDVMVKGMFFGRLTGIIGPDWRKLELSAPPRLDSYLPFNDYPLVDYQRMTIAAARKKHPQKPLAEAIRLLERDTVHAFAQSTVGKVMVGLIGDARTALLKLPEIQRLVARNGEVSAVATSERSVRVEFRNIGGWIDCAVVGNLEGAAQMFGVAPTIDVDNPRPGDGVLEVRW